MNPKTINVLVSASVSAFVTTVGAIAVASYVARQDSMMAEKQQKTEQRAKALETIIDWQRSTQPVVKALLDFGDECCKIPTATAEEPALTYNALQHARFGSKDEGIETGILELAIRMRRHFDGVRVYGRPLDEELARGREIVTGLMRAMFSVAQSGKSPRLSAEVQHLIDDYIRRRQDIADACLAVVRTEG